MIHILKIPDHFAQKTDKCGNIGQIYKHTIFFNQSNILIVRKKYIVSKSLLYNKQSND